MNRAVVAAVFALGLAGCGGSTESMAVEETRDLLAAGEDAPAAGTPVEPGTIRRADLDALLADGPGALLTRVETAPVHKAGRFVGFRITGFPQGAPRAIDLRAGDVVLRVNGHGVERPEQYFEAFRTLAGAAEIRFEILRDGEPMELLYPISK